MEYTFLPAVLAGGLLAYHMWRTGEAFAGISAGRKASDRRGEAMARDELLRSKRLLLEALREVEFDRQAGKLDDDDSGALRRELEPRVMAVMKKIDAIDQVDVRGVAVEAELSRRMTAGASAAALGSTAAASAPTESAASAGKCSTCGRAHGPEDRFCQGCGASTVAYCKACDLRLEPDSRFCQQCGGSVA